MSIIVHIFQKARYQTYLHDNEAEAVVIRGNVAAAYRDAYTLQKTGCAADAPLFAISTRIDGSAGTCRTDGRSDIQAMHAKAFRNASVGRIHLLHIV
jgi:hypothetical protein